MSKTKTEETLQSPTGNMRRDLEFVINRLRASSCPLTVQEKVICRAAVMICLTAQRVLPKAVMNALVEIASRALKEALKTPE